MNRKQTKLLVENWRLFINKEEEEVLEENIKNVALAGAALASSMTNVAGAETPKEMEMKLNNAVEQNSTYRGKLEFGMARGEDEPRFFVKVGDKEQTLVRGRESFDNITEEELSAICDAIIFGIGGVTSSLKKAASDSGTNSFVNKMEKDKVEKVLNFVKNLEPYQVTEYLGQLGNSEASRLVNKFNKRVEDRNIKDNEDVRNTNRNKNNSLSINVGNTDISGNQIHYALQTPHIKSYDLASKLALVYLAFSTNGPERVSKFFEDLN